MRLIKEFNESINYLTEESNDPKKPNVFIEGVFLQSDLKNKNGRVATLMRELTTMGPPPKPKRVKSLMQEFGAQSGKGTVKIGQFLGHLVASWELLGASWKPL